MKPFNTIPKGYRVSMLAVLIDALVEADIPTALSNELEKNKIHRDDIINIESNFSQPEVEYGYVKIVVWYMEDRPIY